MTLVNLLNVATGKAKRILKMCLLFVVLCGLGACTAKAEKSTQADAAFTTLVIASDRGFSANQAVREALSSVSHGNKQLLFVADDRDPRYFEEFVSGTLAEHGAVTVLPLFLSDSDPAWRWARQWLHDNLCGDMADCRFSRVFGESYYGVEALSAALGNAMLHHKKLLLITSGAEDEDSTELIGKDVKRIAQWASKDLHPTATEVFVWNENARGEAWEKQNRQLLQAMQGGAVYPVAFHLGTKLDSMMNLDNALSRVADQADRDLHLASPQDPWLSLWVQRETHRAYLRRGQDIGVVVHAHGSDFHWNESMRRALRSLEEKYPVEYAFSMADQSTIEAALQRLEERGAHGAVVVRIFGRGDSFQAGIERMLGMDVEQGGANPKATQGGHGMMMAGPQARIATPLVVTSTGGLDDHPLFARALLQRAQAISENPADETILLVAHGTGNDHANEVWLQLLESLAAQIDSLSEGQFRAIRYATWREDWPDKREPWIKKVRGYVQDAQAGGGTALVIPARTNATGPEQQFLEGLDFKLGEGFAPHPLFAEWVESQVMSGVENLCAKTARYSE